LQRDRYSPYEFALVIAMAFGWPMLTSVLVLSSGATVGESAGSESFGSTHLWFLLEFEGIVFPSVLAILYARGWRAKDFPLHITKAMTLLGIGMYGISWALYQGLEQTYTALFGSLHAGLETLDDYRPAHAPSLVAVYLVSIVNPVFEEVVVCGYVIPALSKRFGESTAVNVSVIIRATYHLYQGIAVLPYHVAYGLMQAYLYTRLRNLWPLLVNHALGDFVPMLFLI
jgi:membrane protease YdiL (CAAX protease family)